MLSADWGGRGSPARRRPPAWWRFPPKSPDSGKVIPVTEASGRPRQYLVLPFQLLKCPPLVVTFTPGFPSCQDTPDAWLGPENGPAWSTRNAAARPPEEGMGEPRSCWGAGGGRCGRGARLPSSGAPRSLQRGCRSGARGPGALAWLARTAVDAHATSCLTAGAASFLFPPGGSWLRPRLGRREPTLRSCTATPCPQRRPKLPAESPGLRGRRCWAPLRRIPMLRVQGEKLL